MERALHGEGEGRRNEKVKFMPALSIYSKRSISRI